MAGGGCNDDDVVRKGFTPWLADAKVRLRNPRAEESKSALRYWFRFQGSRVVLDQHQLRGSQLAFDLSHEKEKIWQKYSIVGVWIGRGRLYQAKPKANVPLIRQRRPRCGPWSVLWLLFLTLPARPLVRTRVQRSRRLSLPGVTV